MEFLQIVLLAHALCNAIVCFFSFVVKIITGFHFVIGGYHRWHNVVAVPVFVSLLLF